MAESGLTPKAMPTNNSLKNLRAEEKEQGLLCELTLDMVGDVVDTTWPRKLADSVLKNLGKMSGKQISNFVEPKLVGDVLVTC